MEIVNGDKLHHVMEEGGTISASFDFVLEIPNDSSPADPSPFEDHSELLIGDFVPCYGRC